MSQENEQLLHLQAGPELIFGLIAPIGVDLDLIIEVLEQTLREMDYRVLLVRLTQLMREVPVGLSLENTPYIKSFQDRIRYANEVRRQLGNEALGVLAVSAIRAFRAEEGKRERTAALDSVTGASVGERSATGLDEELPLANQAYIVRQLKRQEEVEILRGVYGRQFVLIGGYAPQQWRTRRIEERERQSLGGLISNIEASKAALELVMQDSKEKLEEHGQNVGDAFPLADVFVDATSRQVCEPMIRRFINLLFGSNEVTPMHDEYGMYLAKSVSLRSSDLSRQVGAAIFRQTGEVVTLGCNEVPKAGGGTYWSGDSRDARDFVEGHDPNELRKIELLVDLLDRLKQGGHLSPNLAHIKNSNEIGKLLLAENNQNSVKDSRMMDIIEFGRIIHAEMSAICDASRKGISIDRGILYCTTFPCHICAKHIVASGIKEVVYLEPYPKSYASELHGDSISVDPTERTERVVFRAFIGVSPYRYRDLFEKGKRKYSGGSVQKWNKGSRRPMIEVYFPSYFQAEAHVVSQVRSKLEKLITEHSDQKAPAS
ncbi:MAG TPA: anti-phage dCTP deaminase [Stellaceae bacterium]|jgi:cytidine deaminase|nr:anti-phage dCTP deaminase [Stellaceae bacterium]